MHVRLIGNKDEEPEVVKMLRKPCGRIGGGLPNNDNLLERTWLYQSKLRPTQGIYVLYICDYTMCIQCAPKPYKPRNGMYFAFSKRIIKLYSFLGTCK